VDGDLSELARSVGTGHVVILGGGISGLAAAHRLLQTHADATPGLRVTLVEAEDRLGGKIATERLDGFVIEGGPDSFLATKPRGIGLCEDLGLGDYLQGVSPQRRRAFVLWRGRLHDLPEGLSGLVPTRLAPLARSSLLSPPGKARVALDYLLPARRVPGDESLGGFIRRRLGREAWERLVEPLMAGIYAADGDRLSLAATFPQLHEAERRYGGLIKGVLAARRLAPSPIAAPGSPFLAPAGGLGALVRALETRLWEGGTTLVLGNPATAVTPSSSGFDVRLAGEVIPADAVIVATPAYVAADLLTGFDPGLATELAAIPHASTAIVTLGYRGEEIGHPLDGHGYVIPRAEGSSILACTWSSRKWAGRAPEGWELIRVFIGRAGQEEALAADDDALVALAVQEVAARLGVTAPASLTRVHRWPRGMPQYLLGHPQRVARIEATLRGHAGLYLAGNGFHGVGLPDCIASGERAADAAAAHLRASGLISASIAVRSGSIGSPSTTLCRGKRNETIMHGVVP
jgi:protoporphyrinogen/coproporphyrinogen III oxidase